MSHQQYLSVLLANYSPIHFFAAMSKCGDSRRVLWEGCNNPEGIFTTEDRSCPIHIMLINDEGRTRVRLLPLPEGSSARRKEFARHNFDIHVYDYNVTTFLYQISQIEMLIHLKMDECTEKDANLIWEKLSQLSDRFLEITKDCTYNEETANILADLVHDVLEYKREVVKQLFYEESKSGTIYADDDQQPSCSKDVDPSCMNNPESSSSSGSGGDESSSFSDE